MRADWFEAGVFECSCPGAMGHHLGQGISGGKLADAAAQAAAEAQSDEGTCGTLQDFTPRNSFGELAALDCRLQSASREFEERLLLVINE